MPRAAATRYDGRGAWSTIRISIDTITYSLNPGTLSFRRSHVRLRLFDQEAALAELGNDRLVRRTCCRVYDYAPTITQFVHVAE